MSSSLFKHAFIIFQCHLFGRGEYMSEHDNSFAYTHKHTLRVSVDEEAKGNIFMVEKCVI